MKIIIYSKRLIKILFDHQHFTNQFQSFRWFINMSHLVLYQSQQIDTIFLTLWMIILSLLIRSKVTWPKTWPGYGRMRIWTQVWIVLVISTTFLWSFRVFHCECAKDRIWAICPINKPCMLCLSNKDHNSAVIFTTGNSGRSNEIWLLE